MLRYLVLIVLILVSVIIALQVKLWAGHGGWAEVEMLKQRVAEQRAENDLLKARNDALSAEVEDLKHGDEAVEERARSELGLVKPGEVFYQVVEPSPAPPPQRNNGS